MRELMETVERRVKNSEKPLFLLGIEGACATGKSTLGRRISQEMGGTLLHMDDFFLPFAERGGKDEVGSNINKALCLNEVLLPLSQGLAGRFSPYDCRAGVYGQEIVIEPGTLVIVEGVYVCLPEFRDYFALKIFLTASWAERKRRLLARGSDLGRFEEEWIPREERYFQECAVADCCDFVVDTTDGV